MALMGFNSVWDQGPIYVTKPAIIQASPQQKKSSSSSTTTTGSNASSIYDLILNQLAPGGSYGKGQITELGRTRTKNLAEMGQSLVSSGLANTTTAAGASKKWEEEVGVPARAKIEEARMSAYMQALLGKAGALQQAQQFGLEQEKFAWQKQMDLLAANRPTASGSAPTYAQPTTGHTQPAQQTSQYSSVAPTLGGGGGDSWGTPGPTTKLTGPIYGYSPNAPSTYSQSLSDITTQYTPTIEDLIPSLKPTTPMQSFAETAMSWL